MNSNWFLWKQKAQHVIRGKSKFASLLTKNERENITWCGPQMVLPIDLVLKRVCYDYSFCWKDHFHVYSFLCSAYFFSSLQQTVSD